MTRIITPFFSLAPDFYISAIFYAIVTVNGGFYLYFTAPTYLEWAAQRPGSNGQATFLEEIIFWYVPFLFACLGNIFLTMTVCGDPGIVIWNNDPKRKNKNKITITTGSMGGGMPAAPGTAEYNRQRGLGGGPKEDFAIDPDRAGGFGGQSTASGGVEGQPLMRRGGGGPGGPAGGPGGAVSLEQATQCIPAQEEDKPPEVDDDGLDCYFCPVSKVHVLMFDHHCAVIGACVGKYTMGTFILFLFFACSLSNYGFPLVLYRLYTDFIKEDIITKGNPLEFLSFRHLCMMLNTFAGMAGGGYTFYLWFHYTCFAYQGKNSLYMRRVWMKHHWNECGAMERRGALPITAYFRAGSRANLFKVFKDMKKGWRWAPKYPDVEID